jgi:hypothetical protein
VGSATANAPSFPWGRETTPIRSSLSVDDLDEDSLSFLDATGLHDAAQRLGGAALPADHLAPIVLGDAQLEHHGAVVFCELGDLDLVGAVDQCAGQELEELLQPRIPFTFSSCFTVWLGCAPWASQLRTRSSSRSIVDGSVCGL